MEGETKKSSIAESLDAVTEFVEQSSAIVTAMAFKGTIDALCDSIIADAEKDRSAAEKKLADLGFEVPKK